MTNNRSARIGSLSVEVAVVVLGVLIALAADSWWEGRQEAARASTYLIAIASDMEAGHEALNRVHEGTVEQRDVVGRYVEWASTDLPYPDTLSEPPRRGMTLTSLPVGTLSALITTGDINLIEDPSLRGTLLTEHQRIDDLRRTMWDQQEEWSEIVLAWVYSLQQFGMEGVPSAGPEYAERLRVDPAMSGHYANFYGLLLFRAQTEEETLAAMERIIEAIALAR